jgi:hypothetical protein
MPAEDPNPVVRSENLEREGDAIGWSDTAVDVPQIDDAFDTLARIRTALDEEAQIMRTWLDGLDARLLKTGRNLREAQRSIQALMNS